MKKNNFFTYKMKRSLLILFFIFIIIFTLLMIKIYKLITEEGTEYKQDVISQMLYNQTGYNNIAPKRGNIFDRNGSVLAESIKVYNLIFDPGLLSKLSEDEQNETVNFVSEKFNYSKEKLKDLIKNRSFSYYEKIMTDLTYNEIEHAYNDIITKKVKGVSFEEDYLRNYPNEDMMSDVIGFVNGSNHGTWGVEEYYDDFLQGVPGREFGVVNEGKYVEQQFIEEQNGNNLVLTIDQSIQYFAEEAINSYLKDYDAKSISLITMNPNNGEILAMATYPRYNLNKPYDLSSYFNEEEISAMTPNEKNIFRNSLWRNPVISDTYEPGSPYKAFVIAAALEEGCITKDDTYLCNGYKTVYGNRIECWKEEGHGVQTLGEALANSCNVALMDIADKMGKDSYYNYQRLFGFGKVTNIDLLGETSAKNLVFELDQIGPVELATGSFGQGFNITPIQLISSFSSLVNGGYVYEPYLMKKILNDDGKIVEVNKSKVVRQVISNETADTIKNMLLEVVDKGTGNTAYIDGYSIGGKTGTAEKLPRGSEKYIVSFIGFAPVENPQVITLVTIDEPQVPKSDSRYAARIFKEMMEDTLPYLNIYPTY